MGRKIQMKKEPIRFTAAGDILITKKIPRENDGIAEISRYIKRGDIPVFWISKDMDLICWD